jgi:hypothetical protein
MFVLHWMYPSKNISLLILFLLVGGINGKLSPSLKTVSSRVDPEDAIRFTRSLYQELGKHWNNSTGIRETEKEFSPEHNVTHIGETLSVLLDVSLSDLQESIRHAQKMRKIMKAFVEKHALPTNS